MIFFLQFYAILVRARAYKINAKFIGRLIPRTFTTVCPQNGQALDGNSKTVVLATIKGRTFAVGVIYYGLYLPDVKAKSLKVKFHKQNGSRQYNNVINEILATPVVLKWPNERKIGCFSLGTK